MCFRSVMPTVAVALLFAACGGTSGANGGGSGAGGDGGASGTVFPNGECVGYAVDPSEMRDGDSCREQGGSWHYTDNYCASLGLAQDGVCGALTRTEPGTAMDYGKSDCLRILGCAWQAPDGTKEQNKRLGGTCGGTPLPCSALPLAPCTEENGCQWDTMPAPGSCHPASSSTAPPHECRAFVVPTDPTKLHTHPDVSESLCVSLPGCTFKLSNGQVETQ